MDLMQSLRILRRRWILTSILLLLTILGSVAAAVGLPRTYVADGTTVLLNSKSSAKAAGGNPYLVFSSSLTETADVVRREVMDPRTSLSLAAQGDTATYQVVPAVDTSGPVLLITVTSSSKANAENTLHAVATQVGTKLAGLQTGISSYNQITDLVVAESPKATASLSKLARPLVVILVLGLILTFFIPQIVDAQVARRARRRISAGRDGEWGDGDGANRYSRYGARIGSDASARSAYREAPGEHRVEPGSTSARGRFQ